MVLPSKNFFSGQKRRNKLKNLEEKQELQSKDLSSLCRSNNDIYVTVTSVQKEILEIEERLQRERDSVHDLKSELHSTRVQNQRLEEDIRNLINSKHRLELQLCRMEAKYEGMQRREEEGLSYKEKCTEYGNKIVSLEELISQSNSVAISQQSDFRIKEINHNNEMEKREAREQLLLGELDVVRNDVKRLEEEKISLCKLMREKDEVNEERLRTAWLKFKEVKRHRDDLLELRQYQLASRVRANPHQTLTVDRSTLSILETNRLQQDFKIFRRDELIKALEERLVEHEPDFSIKTDPAFLIYIDDDLVTRDDLNHERMSTATSASWENLSQT